MTSAGPWHRKWRLGENIVARVLNHASEIGKTITGAVYIRHSFAAEKRHALEAWAAELQRIIHNETSDFDVLSIARARAK
jgi:hypothetical protein